MIYLQKQIRYTVNYLFQYYVLPYFLQNPFIILRTFYHFSRNENINITFPRTNINNMLNKPTFIVEGCYTNKYVFTYNVS